MPDNATADLVAQVNRLSLRDGDLLVLTVPSTIKETVVQRWAGDIRELLMERNMKQTAIIVVTDNCDLRALPPEEMAQLGWQPVESGGAGD